MAGSKRIQCVVCEYIEPFDPNLNLQGLLCPDCGRDSTMIVVTPSKPVTTEKRPNYKYKYLASNSKQEWHKVENSFYGEVEAQSEISAGHKVREKYKECIILGRGK